MHTDDVPTPVESSSCGFPREIVREDTGNFAPRDLDMHAHRQTAQVQAALLAPRYRPLTPEGDGDELAQAVRVLHGVHEESIQLIANGCLHGEAPPEQQQQNTAGQGSTWSLMGPHTPQQQHGGPSSSTCGRNRKELLPTLHPQAAPNRAPSHWQTSRPAASGTGRLGRWGVS